MIRLPEDILKDLLLQVTDGLGKGGRHLINKENGQICVDPFTTGLDSIIIICAMRTVDPFLGFFIDFLILIFY